MKIKFSEEFSRTLNIAKSAAKKYSNPGIGSEHILYGMILNEQSRVSHLLRNVGADASVFESSFSMGEHVVIMGDIDFTNNVKSCMVQAFRNSGMQCVTNELMLYSMLGDTTSSACSILTNCCSINVLRVRADLGEKIANGMFDDTISDYHEDGRRSEYSQSHDDKELPSQLADLGVDLTKRAAEHKIDPVIGRSEEIERIIQILCRKTKNNPVLIGEPGVGKSAVVEGLAMAIVEGSVPELLRGKIIFSLDIGSIIAGTKYRGAMEEKLKDAINAIKTQQNIIVFIDELHTLAQAGGKEGEVSPADILKPYLARGELQTIGATTTDEYRKFIEVDKALERRFQPIMVAPPSVEDTVKILQGLKENYESFHKVELSDEAIVAAATLGDRYIMDRYLPDKAIDLIDEAMSRAKVRGATYPKEIKDMEEKLSDIVRQKEEASKRQDYSRAGELHRQEETLKQQLQSRKIEFSKNNEHHIGAITAEDIAQIVSKWTKIPVSKLSATETERLVNLEELLHKRVVGQDKAVTSVAKAIRRARAGLKDPGRPIGTFLFLGPTGVGKTELTKALGEAMFDDENAVIRIDMSEYMESHSVSKLIGAPPGYVGFDDGGQLTEQVRRKPYSVVLFDEIEKAHPDVYNILLQLLDDGRLTDSQGRTVSFKNTIIIMTSNVGVSDLKNNVRTLGFGSADGVDEQRTEDVLMNALRSHFKPEFLNRIDVVSIFNHLTREDIRRIAEVMIVKVNRTLKEKNITLRVTESMMNYIVEHGYDMEYGARPLRRTIEQSIEDNIAEAYLAGKIHDNSAITADYVGDQIVIG